MKSDFKRRSIMFQMGERDTLCRNSGSDVMTTTKSQCVPSAPVAPRPRSLLHLTGLV